MDINDYISRIPDFPKKGILFYDLSPLLASANAWQYTINQICEIVKTLQPDLLAGIESRGFLITAAVATKMKLGSILVRKKGKTPGEVISHTYQLEYGEDTLEVKKDILKNHHRILILDDVLATGGTINATVDLLHKVQCTVVGAICILELTKLQGRKTVSVPTYSLIEV